MARYYKGKNMGKRMQRVWQKAVLLVVLMSFLSVIGGCGVSEEKANEMEKRIEQLEQQLMKNTEITPTSVPTPVPTIEEKETPEIPVKKALSANCYDLSEMSTLGIVNEIDRLLSIDLRGQSMRHSLQKIRFGAAPLNQKSLESYFKNTYETMFQFEKGKTDDHIQLISFGFIYNQMYDYFSNGIVTTVYFVISDFDRANEVFERLCARYWITDCGEKGASRHAVKENNEIDIKMEEIRGKYSFTITKNWEKIPL